eukprot:gene12373-15118_t
MTNEKQWYLSKTIWAAIATIVLSCSSFFNVSLDHDLEARLADTIIQFLTALSGIAALFGRLSATALISPALISASGVLHAGAVPIAPDASQNGALLQLAAADCSQVGQQVAQSQGGTLARATSQTQNGREVCVVVVLIPGKDGERPRRVEVAVPAN